MATVKGSEVKPGQTIRSARRWYTVIRLFDTGSAASVTALVADTKGREGQLLIFTGDDYPVREARPAAPKKITRAKAERFVAAMVALQECGDCPDGLRIALDDARAAISPWYDTEGR